MPIIPEEDEINYDRNGIETFVIDTKRSKSDDTTYKNCLNDTRHILAEQKLNSLNYQRRKRSVSYNSLEDLIKGQKDLNYSHSIVEGGLDDIS